MTNSHCLLCRRDWPPLAARQLVLTKSVLQTCFASHLRVYPLPLPRLPRTSFAIQSNVRRLTRHCWFCATSLATVCFRATTPRQRALSCLANYRAHLSPQCNMSELSFSRWLERFILPYSLPFAEYRLQLFESDSLRWHCLPFRWSCQSVSPHTVCLTSPSRSISAELMLQLVLL